MNVLDRYIAGTILRAFGVVLLAVGALSLVISFLNEADQLGKGSYGLLDVSLFALLTLPERLQLVMPVVALLGALLGLGGLAAGSELVVVRSAGVSVLRLAGSVAVAGLLLAGLTGLTGEWLAPNAMRTAETLRDQARYGPEQVQSVRGGLWLRDQGDVIRIQGSLAEDFLTGVEIYRLDETGRFAALIHAQRARYRDGEWQLEDVQITRFEDNRVTTETQDTRPWSVSLQPSFLRLSVVKPEELSSLGLADYIDYLARNEVATADYRLALWRNLTAPITVFAMCLLALPFAFGSLRSVGAGQRLFVGGLVGVVFFIVNEIAASSGQVYGLPAWLAASWPTLALVVLTVIWLGRLR